MYMKRGGGGRGCLGAKKKGGGGGILLCTLLFMYGAGHNDFDFDPFRGPLEGGGP
jgi:hypothetical protein